MMDSPDQIERSYIIATAGHVDHGKSALVRALTGTDPMRLPEERARGITIDLGFASLRLEGGGGPPISAGIIDVPGHEDFVKNMVAGVGATDLAILVVAADDGWMPQTEEHVQILGYVGVRAGVVALTKIDRVAADAAAECLAAIRGRLRHSVLEDAPIIPTSVVTGGGLDRLRATVEERLRALPPPADLDRPRLWVDRAFSRHGIGTVVTGTLTGGTLAAGATVVVQPGGEAARVRAIQSHRAARAFASPGSRTALNLQGVAVADDHGHAAGVSRGVLITVPGLGMAHDTCDVWLSRSGRIPPAAARPLRHCGLARLHLGTAAIACRVVLAGPGELNPGGEGFAQLRLAGRLPLQAGDRFVLRDAAGRVTLAGGVVVDPVASRRRFRRPEQQAYAAAQVRLFGDPAGSVLARVDRDAFVPRTALALLLPFPAGELEAAVASLLARGVLVAAAGCICRGATWQGLHRRAAALIAGHHASHPAQLGLPLAQLRRALGPPAVPADVFDALVGELTQGGFVREGSAVRRRDFHAALPSRLEPVAARLRAALDAAGLNPPGRRELAADAVRQEALAFLLKTQEVVALGPEVVLDARHFARAAGLVRAHLAGGRRATVSELRQALGISRRIAVPLLERLDRDGVTRRDGEHRILRDESPRPAGTTALQPQPV